MKKFDLWKKHKEFENFKYKNIPDEIKKVCIEIRKDLINKFFNKIYLIGDVNIKVILNFSKTTKPYYSNINIFDILNGIVIIPIKIETEINFDIDYLMGIITHEIRHVYDIFTVADDSEIDDFKKSLFLKSLTEKNKEFIELVYLSLEHELIAYNNMLYESYRYLNVSDKKILLNLIKESHTFKSLQKLKSYNSEEFIKNNNSDKLRKFTDEFSTIFKDDFNDDLNLYYKKWEIFFRKKADEYTKHFYKIADDIVRDNLYEFYKNRYDFGTSIFKIGLCGKLFKKLIKEKN